MARISARWVRLRVVSDIEYGGGWPRLLSRPMRTCRDMRAVNRFKMFVLPLCGSATPSSTAYGAHYYVLMKPRELGARCTAGTAPPPAKTLRPRARRYVNIISP